MAHDFLLVQRAEDFSDQQEKKLLELKNQLWDAAVAARNRTTVLHAPCRSQR